MKSPETATKSPVSLIIAWHDAFKSYEILIKSTLDVLKQCIAVCGEHEVIYYRVFINLFIYYNAVTYAVMIRMIIALR